MYTGFNAAALFTKRQSSVCICIFTANPAAACSLFVLWIFKVIEYLPLKVAFPEKPHH